MRSWRLRNYRNLLPLLAFVLFANALRGTFHFDDYSLFQDPAILSASGWTAIFRFTTTRPLTWLTFWLNYRLTGMRPFAWHMVDLTIHAGCVMLLYCCLRRMIPERATLIGTILFAIHPIQTETVAYVFARPTSLATLLCLASLLCWLRGARWLAVLWFGLAVLAKEECVFFPFFLALIEWPQRKRHFAWQPLAAMLGLSALAGCRVLLATRLITRAGAGFGSSVTPAQYALAQGVVIWRYFGELLWPATITFDPDLHPSAIAGAAGWLALAAAVFLVVRRISNATTGSPALWCIGALTLILASSSIFPADDLAADRRVYLPMIAISAAAGILLDRVTKDVYSRWALAACGLVLAGFTIYRTDIWRTELSLWTDTVAKAPLKARPRIQLSRAQRPADAEVTLAIAAKNNPGNPDVAAEQGKLFLQTHQPDRAIGAFGRAAALAPRDAQNWNNLGVAFAALGQPQAAETQFRHALTLDACLPDARRNLGLEACPETAPR